MNNRIAELRKEKGMTLKQLAEAINIRDNTLSQYETGKRNPHLAILREIAMYFNVSIEYLTKYTDKRDYPLKNNEDALFLLKKMLNEKGVDFTHLTVDTGFKLGMWIIDNLDLIDSKYPELESTAKWFLDDTISRNTILNDFYEYKEKSNETIDEIFSLLLDENYCGVSPEEILIFIKESERIGHKRTKQIISNMQKRADSSEEDNL